MADYWKSQDRKYCDFCKCWIADNRPSVDFHEKGRRHQENVKKRLKTISKNSIKAHKESEKVDEAIKQMEVAALEAYRKDVENNADFTSVCINKMVEEKNLAISSTSRKSEWNELKSPEGKVYYWNTITSETVYEPPEEGYVSLTDQQQEKQTELTSQWKTYQKFQQRDALLRQQEQEKEELEERARLAREKMKERRVQASPEPVITYGPILEPGKTDAYGKWQVVKESAPQIDLQLPQQLNNTQYCELPVAVEEPPVKEFKEKTLESLEDGEVGKVTFKKRKFGSHMKKNARQRLDND